MVPQISRSTHATRRRGDDSQAACSAQASAPSISEEYKQLSIKYSRALECARKYNWSDIKFVRELKQFDQSVCWRGWDNHTVDSKSVEMVVRTVQAAQLAARKNEVQYQSAEYTRLRALFPEAMESARTHSWAHDVCPLSKCISIGLLFETKLLKVCQTQWLNTPWLQMGTPSVSDRAQAAVDFVAAAIVADGEPTSLKQAICLENTEMPVSQVTSGSSDGSDGGSASSTGGSDGGSDSSSADSDGSSDTSRGGSSDGSSGSSDGRGSDVDMESAGLDDETAPIDTDFVPLGLVGATVSKDESGAELNDVAVVSPGGPGFNQAEIASNVVVRIPGAASSNVLASSSALQARKHLVIRSHQRKTNLISNPAGERMKCDHPEHGIGTKKAMRLTTATNFSFEQASQQLLKRQTSFSAASA